MCWGHPFTGDSGMMRDSLGPQDPRIQRPLTHLPPGVCDRERHQHLYVSSIPMWCVWACVYGVVSTGCNNNQHQRETLGTFFSDCPDFSDLYYNTGRRREKERKGKKEHIQIDGERKKERLVELTDRRSLGAGPSCPLCMVGWGVGDVNP